jgi:hypothetical protein
MDGNSDPVSQLSRFASQRCCNLSTNTNRQGYWKLQLYASDSMMAFQTCLGHPRRCTHKLSMSGTFQTGWGQGECVWDTPDIVRAIYIHLKHSRQCQGKSSESEMLQIVWRRVQHSWDGPDGMTATPTYMRGSRQCEGELNALQTTWWQIKPLWDAPDSVRVSITHPRCNRLCEGESNTPKTLLTVWWQFRQRESMPNVSETLWHAGKNTSPMQSLTYQFVAPPLLFPPTLHHESSYRRRWHCPWCWHNIVSVEIWNSGGS